MAGLTDARIDAALERGKAARVSEPRGTSARYDRQRDRIIVELTNGCTFAFPPRLAQGLERATEAQLAQFELLGAGSGLHWEALDVDLSIPGLLAGILARRFSWPDTPGGQNPPPRPRPRGPTAPRADGPERQPADALYAALALIRVSSGALRCLIVMTDLVGVGGVRAPGRLF